MAKQHESKAHTTKQTSNRGIKNGNRYCLLGACNNVNEIIRVTASTCTHSNVSNSIMAGLDCLKDEYTFHKFNTKINPFCEELSQYHMLIWREEDQSSNNLNCIKARVAC